MAPSKVILLACGSFNPPTNMHLRMFELARDNLNRLGQYLVIGGIVSPVHEAYGKKELIPGTYRCEMLKLALKSSDWIQISDWECSQETWSRTKRVLQHHQNVLNSILNDQTDVPNNNNNNNQKNDLENGYSYEDWITNDIRNTEGPIQIKLLCGADLLESFATPGLWADEDVETIIGHHGIVVITRQGTDPRKFIYESDLLTKYQHNIIIVTEWITNDVSSTKVRRAIRRQESVKYLIEDSVIDFIKKHKLYGTLKNVTKYESNFNQNLILPMNTYLLTPSPSDMNMMIPDNSCANNVYLTLNPISTKKSLFTEEENPSLIQSTMECSPNNEQTTTTTTITDNTNKEYKNYNTETSFNSDKIQTSSYEQKKKVGFTGSAQNINENNIIQKKKLENVQMISSDSKEIENVTMQKKNLKKVITKSFESRKLVRAESVKKPPNENQITKENLTLRKSKSDAIMSTKEQNGETPSVKIQFTKEGIKVISDKESIV